MKHVRPWTALEVRRAVEMRAQRHTIAAIAAALGRSYGCVSVRLSRAGATRRYPKNRRQRGAFLRSVARLAKPGVSDRDIARRLRATHQEVYRARRALGIPAGVTSAEGASRNRGVRHWRVACWLCGRRNPSPAAQGWARRPVGHARNRLVEVYCPSCFALHGWPSVPPRQYPTKRGGAYLPRVHTSHAEAF